MNLCKHTSIRKNIRESTSNKTAANDCNSTIKITDEQQMLLITTNIRYLS